MSGVEICIPITEFCTKDTLFAEKLPHSTLSGVMSAMIR